MYQYFRTGIGRWEKFLVINEVRQPRRWLVNRRRKNPYRTCRRNRNSIRKTVQKENISGQIHLRPIDMMMAGDSSDDEEVVRVTVCNRLKQSYAFLPPDLRAKIRRELYLKKLYDIIGRKGRIFESIHRSIKLGVSLKKCSVIENEFAYV